MGEAFHDGQNEAASQGVEKLLVGRTVAAVSFEVWDSDGSWSITLALDDGSVIESPGVMWAKGPLADFVHIAGGDPQESEVG
jgi:hypothetical protein